MFITIFLLLPLLALLVTGNNTYALGTGDPSTLPAISPPFDYEGSIEKGLQESLPLTQFTIDYFSHGEIPQDCKDRAKDHYNASDFEVFSVTYEDCGQPVSRLFIPLEVYFGSFLVGFHDNTKSSMNHLNKQK